MKAQSTRRWLVALALTPAGLPALAAPPARAQTTCEFVLGFRALRDRLGPALVGTCLEDERRNGANGNVEQRTTGGLLVWRQADNWTAFTDGSRTWVGGPSGLQQRPNGERFSWEQDAAGPPPPPAATAMPGIVPPTPEAQAAAAAALGQAATRLGVGQDQLRLEAVAPREWPDSSLGCPQPGLSYLQVVTPGYVVVIVGPDGRLEYHTDTRGRAILCHEHDAPGWVGHSAIR